MIRLKSPEDIQKLTEGGALLAQILDEVVSMVKPGITPRELDDRAQELIAQTGGRPAFLGYGARGHDPFPAALCISINEGVVHGIPTDTPFSEGDLVGVDCGLVYKDMYTDHARTVIAGEGSEEARKLLNVTIESLKLGIAQAHVGNTTGDIGQAVQQYAEDQGYGVVRQLVGHGVGYEVHEAPNVPNFGKAGQGEVLQEGLVIAIEPMLTVGDPAVTTSADGWTIETVDKSLAAHEEHTVAVTAEGPKILTALPVA